MNSICDLCNNFLASRKLYLSKECQPDYALFVCQVCFQTDQGKCFVEGIKYNKWGDLFTIYSTIRMILNIEPKPHASFNYIPTIEFSEETTSKDLYDKISSLRMKRVKIIAGYRFYDRFYDKLNIKIEINPIIPKSSQRIFIDRYENL